MTKSTDYKLSGIANINGDCQILHYTPFGSVMEGRSFVGDTSAWYRFGFGGQEKDDEIWGMGKGYAYEYRIYNSDYGRFLSVDPLALSFPWYSPYHFAGNTPIVAVDMEGAEPVIYWVKSNYYKDGGVLMLSNEGYIYSNIDNESEIFHLIHKNGSWIPYEWKTNCLSCDISKIAKWGGVNALQVMAFAIPIEEIYTLSTGENFDGETVSRYVAAGWFIIGIIPGGKIAKVSVKVGGKFTKEFLQSADLILEGVGAKKFFAKTISNGFKNSKVMNSFNSVMTRVQNILSNNLSDKELTGLVKDIHGYPSNGNHIDEAEKALAGLKNGTKELENMIKDDLLSGEALAEANRAISHINKQIKYVENIINDAIESAAKQ